MLTRPADGGRPFPQPVSKHYFKLVRHALRSLRHPALKRHGWWRAITRPVTRPELWIPCRSTVANGVTIGVFFSMLIVVPFQMLAAALVAMRARANIPLAMAFCWISNPVTFAPLLWLQYRIGDWMQIGLGVPMPPFLSHDVLNIPEIGTVNSASYLLGMMTFAVGGALLAYPLVYLFSYIMPHHLPIRRRRRRDPSHRPIRPDSEPPMGSS